MLAMLWVPVLLFFYFIVGVGAVSSFIASCAMTIRFSADRNWSVTKVLLVVVLALPAPAIGLLTIFSIVRLKAQQEIHYSNLKESVEEFPVFTFDGPIDADDVTNLSDQGLQLWEDVEVDPLKPSAFEVPAPVPDERE